MKKLVIGIVLAVAAGAHLPCAAAGAAFLHGGGGDQPICQGLAPREFFLTDSDTAVSVLSVPSGFGRTVSTVYLLPSSATNAFFPVRAE